MMAHNNSDLGNDLEVMLDAISADDAKRAMLYKKYK